MGAPEARRDSGALTLTSPAIDALAIGLEEAARATEKTAARFVEPAEGTLARAKSNRHHIIFGRRGSGKTSLLLKARTELVLDRRPNAFVDLEKFKGHSYPDVLISVLIETLSNLRDWLREGAIAPANRQLFWRRLFARPTRSPLNRAKTEALAGKLDKFVAELYGLLHAQDGADIETLQRGEYTEESRAGVRGELRSPAAAVGGHVEEAESSVEVTETRERLKRSKVDFLLRRVIEYQTTLKESVQLSDGDGFLLLDDLYHIPRVTQAEVLDYFHRLVKGTGLWLKVGTIRHRSDWYRHGDPSIGMKLGDDAEEIDLDVTLEKYQTAKRFLLKILQQLAEEYDAAAFRNLLTDGAKDRLVLASGGVARDFLSILRKSLFVAREGDEPKIDAESVNKAAGEHESSKRDEFKRDVVGEEDELENEFDNIKQFCLEQRRVNCFLLEKDLGTRIYVRVKELVDLRLLHSIASRVTVRDRPGKLFEAYMVDISQYTGERKRRGLAILEFWKPDDREKLRRASLIYAERSPPSGAARASSGAPH